MQSHLLFQNEKVEQNVSDWLYTQDTWTVRREARGVMRYMHMCIHAVRDHTIRMSHRHIIMASDQRAPTARSPHHTSHRAWQVVSSSSAFAPCRVRWVYIVKQWHQSWVTSREWLLSCCWGLLVLPAGNTDRVGCWCLRRRLISRGVCPNLAVFHPSFLKSYVWIFLYACSYLEYFYVDATIVRAPGQI